MATQLPAKSRSASASGTGFAGSAIGTPGASEETAECLHEHRVVPKAYLDTGIPDDGFKRGDAMPRPRAEEPRSEQLLIRLTAEQYEILRSLAHLEGVKSPNRMAYDVLVKRLEQARQDPLIKADIQNRAAY